MFVAIDSAIIGHLGRIPLGGLSAATAIISATVGMLVFLAYATTPAVARLLGSGRPGPAVSAGIDGMWLAALAGAALTVAGESVAGPLAHTMTADADVAAAAEQYLRIGLLGLAPQLVAMAAVGLLRGLQNTRTPLVVVTIGFAVNAALNALLVYGVGWGLAGSAAGTALVQWGLAAVYAVIAVRLARRHRARMRPSWTALGAVAHSGGWLLLRTASLQFGLLMTVRLAAGGGAVVLAGYQVVVAVFGILQYALDALGVSAQALIGKLRGQGDADRLRALVRLMARWGAAAGAGLAVALIAVHPWLGWLFTTDREVLAAVAPALLVLSLTLPLTGFVYALDGILIGAEDFRYLAIAGGINVAVFIPAWIGLRTIIAGGHVPAWGALVLAWSAFGVVFSCSRAATLGLRLRARGWRALLRSA